MHPPSSLDTVSNSQRAWSTLAQERLRTHLAGELEKGSFTLHSATFDCSTCMLHEQETAGTCSCPWICSKQMQMHPTKSSASRANLDIDQTATINTKEYDMPEKQSWTQSGHPIVDGKDLDSNGHVQGNRRVTPGREHHQLCTLV